ncbi:MAG: hypothetical protein DRJ03_07325 [Chloroflexi bacterium]|nr:MAG: hypothetical protein DRJ03_07325 [Chloroflexota bacterium]
MAEFEYEVDGRIFRGEIVDGDGDGDGDGGKWTQPPLPPFVQQMLQGVAKASWFRYTMFGVGIGGLLGAIGGLLFWWVRK